MSAKCQERTSSRLLRPATPLFFADVTDSFGLFNILIDCAL